MHARDRELLNDGPAGTGKSIAALFKCLIICDHVPNVRGAFVRKTRRSLTDSALVTFETKVVPPWSSLLEGARRANRHSYTFPNGAEIAILGMDNAERIMSTDFDFFYIQEATELSEDDWELLSTRLRNFVLPYQQIMADCNPHAPTHWLNRRCDRGVTRRVRSKHRDNPMLWDHKKEEWTPKGVEYMKTLDALTGVRRLRLRDGIWAAAEGVVYEIDQNVHMVEPFLIPREWKRIRCIDFGFTNPFCCLWIAFDGDKRGYVYRQIYMTRRLVQDHAAQIKNLSAGEFITKTVADHDAEDRATLERYGIPTITANKAIRNGIDCVTDALAIQPDGKPRLMFFRDSLVEKDGYLDDAKLPYCLEQEFDCYRWPDKKPDKNSKEVPIDDNNHGMDALRYGMMLMHGGGGDTQCVRGPKRVSSQFRNW